MNFELAVKKITSRKEKNGYECAVTLDELYKWLEISFEDVKGKVFTYKEYRKWEMKLMKGFELENVFELLNDQLVVEHSICLEVAEDFKGFYVVRPCEITTKLALSRAGREPRTN